VNAASFSRDGRWLVTAGPGKAALWQTQTGRLLIYLSGHAKAAKGARGLESASFSPEGRRILTASDDGTVRLYTCGICARIPGLVRLAEERLVQVSRGLTPPQRRKYLP
jgi:WD40 repeat protein